MTVSDEGEEHLGSPSHEKRSLCMEHLDFDLIDCHTHIGHMPGAMNFVLRAEDLDFVVCNEGARYALASSPSSSLIGQRFGSLEVLDAARRFPRTIGPMIWVNPQDPNWEEDAEAMVKEGFLGIKIHPPIGFYRVDKEGLENVFAFAQSHHLPILTHAATDAYHPYLYKPLLEAYPEARLLLGHFGPYVEGIQMAKKYRNVYLDTTAVPAEAVEMGARFAGSGKVLFGADAPMGFRMPDGPSKKYEPPAAQLRTYRKLMDEVIQTGLPRSDLENIFHNNVVSLFNLKGL